MSWAIHNSVGRENLDSIHNHNPLRTRDPYLVDFKFIVSYRCFLINQVNFLSNR